jgi:hypothetical protein
VAILALACAAAACGRGSSLPAAIRDSDYWGTITALSEAPGVFPLSENLVSNEPRFAENVRWLHPSGGVYVGVGPEQNFSYIARLRPAVAFIVDIRQENRNLHLLYKALFELAGDRADFVSLLFSRPRPAGLSPGASAREIFERYAGVAASDEQFARTIARVRDRLVTVRGLPLTAGDLADADRILKTFATDGPDIQFWGARTVHADAVRPTYRELMTARDSAGLARSFLAGEAEFRFVKEMQTRNLILPLVGDFAGADALRRVAEYARAHGEEVAAFYASNVGVYLNSEQTRAFCGNLAALPVSRRAAFIENDAVRAFSSRLAECRPSASSASSAPSAISALPISALPALTIGGGKS